LLKGNLSYWAETQMHNRRTHIAKT
jgi:hypothetical protein